MGILVMLMMMDLSLELKPIIAMQVKVPIMVEKMVARTAMVRVFIRALATVSSEKRLMYQFRVKPPQRALDLLELKDRMIRVMMGAYMKIRMIAM
jgi:hypothetical protein